MSVFDSMLSVFDAVLFVTADMEEQARSVGDQQGADGGRLYAAEQKPKEVQQ